MKDIRIATKVIFSCWHCPHKKTQSTGFGSESVCNLINILIDNVHSIPAKCPLPKLTESEVKSE